MAKVFTFVTILLGIMLTFALFGVADSNTSQLLRSLGFGDLENLKGFNFFDILFNSTSGIIAALAGVGAIVVGSFVSQSRLDVILAGFTSTLAGWVIGDMISIIQNAQDVAPEFPFIGQLVTLFFVLFIGAFLVAIIEFVKGAD